MSQMSQHEPRTNGQKLQCHPGARFQQWVGQVWEEKPALKVTQADTGLSVVPTQRQGLGLELLPSRCVSVEQQGAWVPSRVRSSWSVPGRPCSASCSHPTQALRPSLQLKPPGVDQVPPQPELPSSRLGRRCPQAPLCGSQCCLALASPAGRDPEVNQEALEEFEKVVEARGLKTDSISIPKQRGRKGTALPDPGSLRTGQAQLAPGLLAGAGEMLADRGSRGPVEFPGPQPWFSLFSRSLLSRKRLGPESRALKRPWRPHRSPPATHTGQPRRLPPRAPLPFRNKQLQPLPDSSFLSVGSGAPQGDF
ncbi:uncharacterized protein LOC101708422 isoform X1 [Heterocephalus glaber]|uniref:Uncharacterized protein LOC101708422 isoform X1 n=1 Tax=Heterocephalus glaber TaxID=10181 RepID=A0AAX6T9F2_HETGA|nr:uncharacterized protein LOC101708422 isoform X1 [Heterocephalus glaber]